MTPTRWSSRLSFIFATSAAAIGLGNIWRFPYLAGQNGGGLFVLLYLLFVILLGVPLMTSEVMLGRIGRAEPATAIKNVAQRIHRSRYWSLIGGLSILASYLILSYYVVIAGWVLNYFLRAITGAFYRIDDATAIHHFQQLQSSHWQMLASTTVIVFLSMVVIALGIKRGLERAVIFMFPALLILLLLLVMYAASSGFFHQAVLFLFQPRFNHFSTHMMLLALGQAFFSLNIGMAVNIMFSAYLPEKAPIITSVLSVCAADTGIALLSGLAIFPIVFANHLTPASGPSLIFRTLPLAFSHMPGGRFVAALFFLLLLFAAFTSAIALLEPVVAWLMTRFPLKRTVAVTLAGVMCWLLSLGTISSFSHPQYWQWLGTNFFHAIDFLTADVMLPLGGLLIAIFTGWLLPQSLIGQDLNWRTHQLWFQLWRFLKRYVVPLFILLIILMSFKLI